MQIGYRIIRPKDVDTQNVKFAQISLWSNADWGVADGDRGVREAIETARECTSRSIRTVYHPLEYPLTGEKGPHSIDVMRRLAAVSDLGIIIHDEGEKGKRLTGAEAEQYERGVKIISGLCPVSIENSYDSGDITWFWERFVVPMPETVSITLDIGHLELADIVSTEFVRHLPDHLVRRIQFVHMHHHDRNGHGVKDHRPLVPDCREIEALKILIERKKDLWVIVELDAAEEGMGRSIELLERMQNAQ